MQWWLLNFTAHQTTARCILEIYCIYALIRSRLDYGSVVSAPKIILENEIQTRALILCTGAVRNSPVWALQVDPGEMTLCLQRLVNYWINLRSHGDSNPKVLQACWVGSNHLNQVLAGQEMQQQETWEYMKRSFVQLWYGLWSLCGY